MDEDIPIKGLMQWTFYLLGWLFGALNPIFWLMLFMIHLAYDEHEKFFDPKFHKRVYWFGITMTILLILIFLIWKFI